MLSVSHNGCKAHDSQGLRTEERQPIIVSAPALVEALVRHGQPLDLVAQQLVPAVAEEALVEVVEPPDARVDGILVAGVVLLQTHGRGHALGRVCPSPPRFGGRCGRAGVVGAAGGGREGAAGAGKRGSRVWLPFTPEASRRLVQASRDHA